jgi:hypothetical protein
VSDFQIRRCPMATANTAGLRRWLKLKEGFVLDNGPRACLPLPARHHPQPTYYWLVIQREVGGGFHARRGFCSHA